MTATINFSVKPEAIIYPVVSARIKLKGGSDSDQASAIGYDTLLGNAGNDTYLVGATTGFGNHRQF